MSPGRAGPVKDETSFRQIMDLRVIIEHISMHDLQNHQSIFHLSHFEDEWISDKLFLVYFPTTPLDVSMVNLSISQLSHLTLKAIEKYSNMSLLSAALWLSLTAT